MICCYLVVEFRKRKTSTSAAGRMLSVGIRSRGLRVNRGRSVVPVGASAAMPKGLLGGSPRSVGPEQLRWQARRASMRVRSIYAGDQVSRPGDVGRVLRKGRAQNSLLVAHPLQLKAQADGHQKHGPGRGVLEKQPDRSDYLGGIQRMPDEGVGPLGDQAACFGHDAEGAS
jgi:hypothetical protein